MQAYIDAELFGHLPYSGGTFDQPAQLMSEMRYVASVVGEARQRRREAQQRDLEAQMRRR